MPQCRLTLKIDAISQKSSNHFLKEFYEMNFPIAQKARDRGSALELALSLTEKEETRTADEARDLKESGKEESGKGAANKERENCLLLKPTSQYMAINATLSSISCWVNEKLQSCRQLPKEYRFIQFFREYAEIHNRKVRRYNELISSWRLLKYLDRCLANFNPQWTLKAPEIELSQIWTPSEKRMRQTARLALKQQPAARLSGQNTFIFSKNSFKKSSYLKSERFFVNVHESSCQGRRPSMENRHLVTCTEQGDILLGIFDGHGDDGLIAQFLKEHFSSTLEEQLKIADDDPFCAFQKTAEYLHQQVRQLPFGEKGGSTALICLLRRDFVYTATIGDSLAYHLRPKTSSIDWAPLSLKLDWHSKLEQERYKQVKGKPMSENEQARCRVKGLKISRAIGDKKAGRLISCHPKVTMHGLQGGDILLLGCDGLYDYLSIPEIAATLDGFQWEEGSNFAEELQQKALYQGLSMDNITIIAAHLTDIP